MSKPKTPTTPAPDKSPRVSEPVAPVEDPPESIGLVWTRTKRGYVVTEIKLEGRTVTSLEILTAEPCSRTIAAETMKLALVRRVIPESFRE